MQGTAVRRLSRSPSAGAYATVEPLLNYSTAINRRKLGSFACLRNRHRDLGGPCVLYSTAHDDSTCRVFRLDGQGGAREVTPDVLCLFTETFSSDPSKKRTAFCPSSTFPSRKKSRRCWLTSSRPAKTSRSCSRRWNRQDPCL